LYYGKVEQLRTTPYAGHAPTADLIKLTKLSILIDDEISIEVSASGKGETWTAQIHIGRVAFSRLCDPLLEMRSNICSTYRGGAKLITASVLQDRLAEDKSWLVDHKLQAIVSVHKLRAHW
jgi:hypothetical protein